MSLYLFSHHVLHDLFPRGEVSARLEARVSVLVDVAVGLVDLERLAQVLLDGLQEITQEVASWKKRQLKQWRIECNVASGSGKHTKHKRVIWTFDF